MNRKIGVFWAVKSLLRLLRAKPVIPESLEENELLKAILRRRSVRVFSKKAIPEDVFAAILEAGRLAPSTVNLQSWTFAVFDAPRWRETFGSSIPFHGDRAVILIADCYRYRQVLPEFPTSPLTEYTAAVVNTSLAAMNMNIAAEALGVSSVMLSETGRSGILDAAYLKKTLQLPDGAVPLMTLVLGYARSGYPPMPPKLPLDQVVIDGRYRPPDPVVLRDWLDQMIAGYNASHLGMSFEGQLEVYRDKISRAETDLRDMVFYRKD